MNFVVPANHRRKIKESELIDKYLYLARELKKLWNVRVKVIAIEGSGLGAIPKNLEIGLEEFTSQCENRNYSNYGWDRLKYWKESWWPEETCCHSDTSERPPTNISINLTDWSLRLVNLSRVILCLVARKLHSLYVHIYILIGHSQVLLLRVRVKLGVMAMKEYFKLHKSQELEPHYQMQFNDIFRTLLFWGWGPYLCGED